MEQWAPTAGAFGVCVMLIITLLRMRSSEIKDMGKRIGDLEHDNRVCLVIQNRLIRVVQDNGLRVPEGTFDVSEVLKDASR